MAEPIEVRTLGSLIEPYHCPLGVLLRYDEADPLAVTLELTVPDTAPVPWTFGRSLLAEGLHRLSGNVAGEVQISPARPLPWLWVYLIGEDGRATLRLPRGPVARFLEAAYRVVPAGNERVDVDGALLLILADAEMGQP